MIRAIVAIDDKRGIAKTGNQTTIPWDIPADRQYFVHQTTDAVVVMGRETYQLFDEPLSQRDNIVFSKHLKSVRPGFKLESDLAAYLEQVTEDVWVIGGAGLYQAALPFCDELYVTQVTGDFYCDRFFPAFIDRFHVIRESAPLAQNNHQFRFCVYAKNR